MFSAFSFSGFEESDRALPTARGKIYSLCLYTGTENAMAFSWH